MGELDPDLYTRLGLLLSDKTPIIDNLVQEAALKSTTVLVQRLVFITSLLSLNLSNFSQFSGDRW